MNDAGALAQGLAVAVLALGLGAAAWLWRELRRRHLMVWLPAWLRQRPPPPVSGPVHVLFAFCDHFEPGWGRPGPAEEARRVQRWADGWAALAPQYRDADGRPPQHSFFYPEEEYRPELLEPLAELCRQGLGEIEVHLHHDHDTAAGLRARLAPFVQTLHQRHGALPRDPATGAPAFGFIHGNWALDNAHGDGTHCGVADELRLLASLGCYADFTLPSAPSPTQTRQVNSLYRATGHPQRPKSHDTGAELTAGQRAAGDLLIVQGPLALDWRNRKAGLLPRIENADVRAGQLPTPARVALWLRQHIHVRGRPEWLFIKVHSHGAQPDTADVLLGEPMHALCRALQAQCNDGRRHVLHYVTAREMVNIALAAEAGRSGNPNDFRDFHFPLPPMRGGPTAAVAAGAAAAPRAAGG